MQTPEIEAFRNSLPPEEADISRKYEYAAIFRRFLVFCHFVDFSCGVKGAVLSMGTRQGRKKSGAPRPNEP